MRFIRRLAVVLLCCGLGSVGTGCDSATTTPETKDTGPQPTDTAVETDAEIGPDTTATTDAEAPTDTPVTTDAATTDAATTDATPTPDATVTTDAASGDPCDPNPCENGGVCAAAAAAYTCACAAGYSGANCESNIDDCVPNPCENGGACQDGVDSYTCTCVEGYTGTNCETLPLASVILQQDFESTEEDAIPADWHSFVGWVTDQNNTKDGQAYALVDSTKPHGGDRSLHVVGGSLPAMLTVALPPDTKAIYVRTYVWLTQKLGQNPGNNHETLLGIRKSIGGAYDEVRFGEIKGVIGTNEVPSDDISPKMEQWGKGPLISAGAWHCLEVAFLGDGPNHQIIAWRDGEEVHRIDDPSQWNNKALGPTFLDGKFVEFIIGWHSFSNYDNEVWFDDLVIAKEKIGCN